MNRSEAGSGERIVITGMGVVAPGACGVAAFESQLREGRSAIRFWPQAAEAGLGCQVGGVPNVDASELDTCLPPPRRRVLTPIMEYAALAAIECWTDAGFILDLDPGGKVDWDTGIALGTGLGAIDTLTTVVGPAVAEGQHRKMGSRIVERIMISGPTAAVGGILGLGGPAITVSSACSSATSAIHRGAQALRLGICSRTLAGGVEIPSIHTAATFDAMRVLCREFNDRPESASRPLSATAAGFVPAGGAGFLMLETLSSALERGARIYAELAGSYENSGGQRSDGTMTVANTEGAVRCIRGALADAATPPEEIDYINGHLTGTMGDAREIRFLREALGRCGCRLPWINATKSLIGHALGAAGAIESIATVIQITGGFLHRSANCGDLHPEVSEIAGRVPMETVSTDTHAALKTSFGFGDVNACLVFRKYEDPGKETHTNGTR